YDLTDEFIDDVWIYIPYEKNIRVLGVRPVRKRQCYLEGGIVEHDDFIITSIERTLIDIFFIILVTYLS
ncbi:MAG: hypothetical protein KAG61_09980, partial [Bacteriovoracaceae bacterium]|nr:hypothetical protein [Bacteriovoracaceae bacterium]